jgi:hypothetical protein
VFNLFTWNSRGEEAKKSIIKEGETSLMVHYDIGLFTPFLSTIFPFFSLYSRKRTQSEMKFTLWHLFLLLREHWKEESRREGEAEQRVVPFICQNRRFHISNTRSQCFQEEDEDEAEQSDEKFNTLCARNNPFLLARWKSSDSLLCSRRWLLHFNFNLIMDDLAAVGFRTGEEEKTLTHFRCPVSLNKFWGL